MKYNFLLLSFLLLGSNLNAQNFASTKDINGLSSSPGGNTDAKIISERNSQAALLFTENKGQVADVSGNLRPDILFTAHSGGAKIFLTATGIHYQFTKTVYPEGYNPHNPKAGMADMHRQHEMEKDIATQTHRFTLSLQGATPHPQVIKEERSDYTENFYHAHCPDGITGVHTYSRLVYKNVYPGIDWVLYSNGAGMKYDFVLQPGADPALIRLEIKDAESVNITGAGELLIKTSLGEVLEDAPVSFAGDRKLTSKFKQLADGIIGFEVEKNNNEILTIDPAISWATYYGGSGDEGSSFGNISCAVDGAGNVYLGGSTNSTTGIASGGFQNVFGGNYDAFLVKFNAAGSRLWATYYGSSGGELGASCAVDGAGNVYLAGHTGSTTGIASGGFQNVYGGGTDVFLVKFNASGSRLWATYYGGSGADNGYLCAVDGAGNVYLGGRTTSITGIASGGFQNVYGGGLYDAFLVKFDSSGSRLWATYYGENDVDWGLSCTVDSTDNVYLAGSTASTTGIASGGFQNVHGGNGDAFLVKFDASGSRLWATYYGGSSVDEGSSCAVDGAGNVYLAGNTWSTTGIASGGFQNVHGGGSYDAFLVKFNTSGSRLWATYYGGSNFDWGNSCAVDGTGNIYLSGTTKSTTGIASGGFQNMYSGGTDAFLVKFNTSGSRLWATYYGGSGFDSALSCVVDGASNVYLAGRTTSTTSIASGGFQNIHGGGFYDSFLAKISDCLPSATTLTNTSCGSYTLNGQTYNNTGTYTQLLTNAGGCDSTITLNLTINTVDTSVTQTGNTLTANATGAAYQWLDCNNNYAPISGETNALFVPVTNGNYAVAITQNGCLDTSGCHTISGVLSVQSTNTKATSQLHIYPNPNHGEFTIQLDTKTGEPLTIEVYNQLGQKVYSEKEKAGSKSFIKKIVLPDAAPGIYYVQVRMGTNIYGSKLVLLK